MLEIYYVWKIESPCRSFACVQIEVVVFMRCASCRAVELHVALVGMPVQLQRLHYNSFFIVTMK